MFGVFIGRVGWALVVEEGERNVSIVPVAEPMLQGCQESLAS